MPTVPDFIRSTPPASLHAYFMSIKAVLPADVVWEGAANEVVPPLLRAVDAMDDAERLRVMNDADRVGAMADEPGQAALYSITGSPETLDSLENGHARALWMFLKDPAGFGHAEEVRYADDRRYGRMWDGFECLLVLGDGGTIRNAEKLYTGLNVIRQTLSDWSSEADIGITVRNVDASQIELRRVEGFTIGMRTLGDGRGVEDSTFTLGRIVNNRIGLDIWCATATAWNTSIRYYGGHFAHATGVNAAQDRFGIRLGNEPGAYTNHNRHVFDAPNFELRQAGSNIAIPFLNQTSGSAIIARNMRMEACSPMAARHTAGAQDCEYDIAWTNTYLVGIDYTATANRCGNAVINRHRAPASRLQRFLAGVPNTRAAAFRQSATEVGVEGLITIATSTTTATFMADFCFNGLTDLTPTDRAVTLAANRGLGWMLDTSQAKEFALAHWLTSGASGGRLFVRVFDGAGNVREDIAGDVLASITTMQWNGPAKGWNAGAPMDDANFNRRQTIRVGAAVAYAQVGVIGFDGPIDLQSLRLYGLPEAAPAVLNGTPLLTGALFGSGRREFAAEVSWDLPSLTPGAMALLDVTVNGARAGDLAAASLVSSTRFIELDAAVWSNNTARVMARNISGATFDLAAVTLSVGVTKRRVP